MPWKASDAEGKTKKADTPEKQGAWARLANAVLKDTGDEGRAIKVANAAVAKMGEAFGNVGGILRMKQELERAKQIVKDYFAVSRDTRFKGSLTDLGVPSGPKPDKDRLKWALAVMRMQGHNPVEIMRSMGFSDDEISMHYTHAREFWDCMDADPVFTARQDLLMGPWETPYHKALAARLRGFLP